MTLTRPDRATVRDAALAGGAYGALTLLDRPRLGPAATHGVRLALAGLSGWLTYRTLQRDPSMPPVMPTSWLGGAAGAALALATAPLDEAQDRWFDERLSRHLTHPRPVMATLAAGVLAAAVLADRAQVRTEDLLEVEEVYVEQDLDPRLRALLLTMADAGEGRWATALRAQLEIARCQHLIEEMAPGTVQPDAPLEVPEDAPRVLPLDQTWPVRARWTLGGHPVELTLGLSRGLASFASLMPLDDDAPDGLVEEQTAWPAPNEVELVTEALTGDLVPTGTSGSVGPAR